MTEWTPPTSALRPYLPHTRSHGARLRRCARERGLDPVEAEQLVARLHLRRWADQVAVLDIWAPVARFIAQDHAT